MSFIGAGTTLVSTDETYDPQDGFTLKEVYEGSPDSISVLVAASIIAGVKVATEKSGGALRCTLTYGGGSAPHSTPEKPSDKFTIKREFIQEPLWYSHLIYPIVYTFQKMHAPWASKPWSFTKSLTRLRTVIEQGKKGFDVTFIDDLAVAEKKCDGSIPPDKMGYLNSFDPSQSGPLDLYRQVVRGLESVEVERVTLGRVRTYSSAYAPRIELEKTPVVYTTAAMVRDFEIPNIIANQFVKLPDAADDAGEGYPRPENTAWAWRNRGSESDFLWNGKVEERTDWIFGAASTIFFQLIE